MHTYSIPFTVWSSSSLARKYMGWFPVRVPPSAANVIAGFIEHVSPLAVLVLVLIMWQSRRCLHKVLTHSTVTWHLLYLFSNPLRLCVL